MIVSGKNYVYIKDFWELVKHKRLWHDYSNFAAFIGTCDKKGLITKMYENQKAYIEERYVGFFLNLHSLSSVYLLLTIHNKC